MKQTLFIISFITTVLFSVQAFTQTFEIIDINPEGSSAPKNFFNYGDQLLFSAYTDDSGYELWISDGTSGGTKQLKDINIEGSSNPDDFIEYNGEVIFSAAATNLLYKIWLTDGSSEGTKLIKDLIVPQNPNPGGFVEYNDLLFFRASSNYNELWLTNGIEEETIKVKDVSSNSMLKYNNMLIFSGNEGAWGYGSELWKSNGTEESTVLVKDICIDGSSNPMDFTEYNGKLYFNANDGIHNRQLWVTDGTTDGTIMLTDYFVESNESYPHNFIVYNDKLIFRAGTDGNADVWQTDGTTEGTHIVKDINPDGYSTVYGFTEYNGKLYFNANDHVNGKELWVSDGTENGTHVFMDINPGKDWSYPALFFEYNSKLYFTATEQTNNRELWVTDGSVEGTKKIAPVGSTEENPLVYDPSFTIMNGSLYFTAGFTSAGWELWKLTTVSSTDEIEQSKAIIIYPNPATNRIKIDINDNVEKIEIYNIIGKLVLVERNTSSLNIKNLDVGNYSVKIYTGNSIRTAKFIKID